MLMTELLKHTRLTAVCPRLPGSAGTRKVKKMDFTEARVSEWQWHQLGHMQVCILLQTDNHASTPPLSFLQAGCPSCRPTNSVKALKAMTELLSCANPSIHGTDRVCVCACARAWCVRACVHHSEQVQHLFPNPHVLDDMATAWRQ